MNIIKIENTTEFNQSIIQNKMRKNRNIRFYNHIDNMFEQGNMITVYFYMTIIMIIIGWGSYTIFNLIS